MAHPGREPSAEDLRRILERNLVGIDIDKDAVRVASFSLYLAMCDEIDPRHYWSRVQFPRLRGTQLKHADFFREDVAGIRTEQDGARYDVVVGNAPWGARSVTTAAEAWARKFGWQSAYKDLGPLFLPKVAALTKEAGWITMLQPAGAMLFNRVRTAREFRQALFTKYDVAEVVNLSALRYGLFQKAISPACIVTLRACPPNSDPITYICPKSVQTHEDDFRVAIEPTDIHEISRREASSDPLIWTALAWGGRRDYALVHRLDRFPTLGALAKKKAIRKRQGIIRGDRKTTVADTLGRRIVKGALPTGTILHLDPRKLPLNDDPEIHSKDSKDFAAFALPQLIVKQAWTAGSRRFQAVLVRDTTGNGGVLCSESYVTIHAPDGADILEAACLSLNSCFAVYYLLLTSGRFASYRPEPNTEDLLAVPIPLMSSCPEEGEIVHDTAGAHLTELGSLERLDERVRRAFRFQDVEWALIRDIFDYTLPDFKGDASSPGRARTSRRDDFGNLEPELMSYGEQLLRVLKSGFGRDKRVRVAIFHDPEIVLPVRLVAVYLDGPEDGVAPEALDSASLHRRLRRLDGLLADDESASGGIFYQRVARIFDTTQINGRRVPTVYFAKPDRVRYWTRSAAVRDADELAAQIMTWGRMVSHAAGVDA